MRRPRVLKDDGAITSGIAIVSLARFPRELPYGADRVAPLAEAEIHGRWHEVPHFLGRVSFERPLQASWKRRHLAEQSSDLAEEPKEFGLLELFMAHPGEVLSRLQLLEGAWDMACEPRSNVVDVYVRYLREKIDKPFVRRSLETVCRVGYRLREDGG